MKQKEINKVEIRNLQKKITTNWLALSPVSMPTVATYFGLLNKSTNSFAYSPKDKSSRLSMIKSWAVPSLSS